MADLEIEAIVKCHELFTALEDDSKVRVIQWLISKFQLSPQSSNWPKNQPTAPNLTGTVKVLPLTDLGDGKNGSGVLLVETSVEGYDSVADLFSAASPNVDWEKALVVATFLQLKNGLSDFTSFEVNKELKNLGYPSANITDAFDVCIGKRPQLILQLRKEGNSRQARKKYKVSNEGVKLVKNMLLKGNSESGQ